MGKVDLDFGSFSLLQYISVYNHEYIQLKKKSLMQTVEKSFLSLMLAVKNKDSSLFLCAHPHVFLLQVRFFTKH